MPDPAALLAVPAVLGLSEVPDVPEGLGDAGRATWEAVWASGCLWVAASEAPFELQWLCEAADEREQLRRFVELGGDERYRRDLRALEKQMTQWVQDLGFSPASRARLGVGHGKAASAIEELRRRHDE
jgi:hypothetical protein